MNANDDVVLHDLQTIEASLCTELGSEQPAESGLGDGFMVGSASGFMVGSASGFMVGSASGFMVGSASGFMVG
jgi:hypothetical protein